MRRDQGRGGEPDCGGLPSGSPNQSSAEVNREDTSVMTTQFEHDTAQFEHDGPVAMAGTPVMVERAIRRCGEDFYRAVNLPTDTRAQQVLRAERLAEVAERRARWWGVLIRWVFNSGTGAS